MNHSNSHSQKRCTQCFESKPLDFINFRFKRTEQRWVSKCRVCEGKTRNKQNNNKKALAQKRTKKRNDSISTIRVTISKSHKLGMDSLSELLGMSILEEVRNGKV